jgi:hypothetical protein
VLQLESPVQRIGFDKELRYDPDACNRGALPSRNRGTRPRSRPWSAASLARPRGRHPWNAASLASPTWYGEAPEQPFEQFEGKDVVLGAAGLAHKTRRLARRSLYRLDV